MYVYPTCTMHDAQEFPIRATSEALPIRTVGQLRDNFAIAFPHFPSIGPQVSWLCPLSLERVSQKKMKSEQRPAIPKSLSLSILI